MANLMTAEYENMIKELGPEKLLALQAILCDVTNGPVINPSRWKRDNARKAHEILRELFLEACCGENRDRGASDTYKAAIKELEKAFDYLEPMEFAEKDEV